MEAAQVIRFKGTCSPCDLPQEIMEEILVRLPVESLLRLKCVSKSWCLLISSSRFVRAHVKKSSEDKSLERHQIIIETMDRRDKRCLLKSFLYEPPPVMFEDFKIPTLGSGDFTIVIGSCNGLVCVLNNARDFMLWNPSTRKFKKLPCFFDIGYYSYTYDLLTAGFGFDESNDDYKILAKGFNHREIKIYSLKMDCWRKADDVVDFEFCNFGVFVSGKLHWQAMHRWDRCVSFDLENEEFGTVEWPRGIEDGALAKHAVQGCLCFSCPSTSSKVPGDIDYWIMKEYGVKDSWCKFATVACLALAGAHRYFFNPWFVGVDGEILAWDDLYKKKMMPSDSVWVANTHIHVESLVSL